jgi:multicomponent Na+:H+ antiporter subunit E
MTASTKWKITRVVLTALYLVPGWLLFTWSLDLYNLLLGSIFCLAVALLSYGVFIDEQEAARRALLPRPHLIVVLLVVLIARIYIASAKMIPKILTGDISPRIVHFRSKLRSDVARVVLANAITLTPGTLTLDLSGDHLIVHWLDAPTSHSTYAKKLITEPFELWLKRIWN